MGGSHNDEDATTASLNADLYDPTTNTFTSAGANAFPRLYHSGSLLLPDATVLLVGGNPVRGTYEAHMEIYSPAYLFNGDGTRAAAADDHQCHARVRSATAATFQVQTPDAADIAIGGARAAWRADACLRHGSAAGRAGLHGGSGRADVTAPPNGNIAPPGLLHAVHPERGRGAVGREVRAAVGHDSQSASNRPYCEPVRERHGERGSAGLLHGRRERC